MGDRSGPVIPDWIYEACFLPNYKNIYSVIAPLDPEHQAENRSRLYCTETLSPLSDWQGEVLFLAKDAGPATVFESLLSNGDVKPWRAAERRLGDDQGVRTNENLLEFVRGWSVAGLYGSLMANLLRNDGRQSGALPGFDNPPLVRYVRDVLCFVVEHMPELRAIVCLGDDSWRHVHELAGCSVELDHDRGAPARGLLAGKNLQVFRMFHPSRMFAGGRVAREAEWSAVAQHIQSE